MTEDRDHDIDSPVAPPNPDDSDWDDLAADESLYGNEQGGQIPKRPER